MTDEKLFNERDFWQHPRTFEQLRKGDCEDFALWAWRKLTDMDVDARFFVGRWKPEMSQKPGMHAWVGYRNESREYLLEPLSRNPKEMVKPLEVVKLQYEPHFSVNKIGATQTYAGFITYLKSAESERCRLGHG